MWRQHTDYWPQYEPNFGPWNGRRLRYLAPSNNYLSSHYVRARRPGNFLHAAQGQIDHLYRIPPSDINAYGEVVSHANQALYTDFSQTAKLDLERDVSSTEATVRWNHPVTRGEYKYEVSIIGHHNDTKTFPDWKTSVKMKLVPGNWYQVSVKAVSESSKRTIAEGVTRFKSVLSRAELIELYQRATQYVEGQQPQMHQIQWLYRNKPTDYFENIHRNEGGIMRKYLKDQNGQPGTPINNQIEGLFFAARLQNGQLPDKSIYGNKRFLLEPGLLFNANTRLYFSDFYCNYSLHYVTLVLTIRGSPTDEFCERTLVELNPRDNIWLCMTRYEAGPLSRDVYWANNQLWIEVLYTEDVDLRLGWFQNVFPLGKGSSTPGGLPNNKFCTICNLYPEPLPEDQRKRKSSSSSGECDAKRQKTEESAEEDDDSAKKEQTLSLAWANRGYSQSTSTYALCQALIKGDGSQSYSVGGSVALDISGVLCSLIDTVVNDAGNGRCAALSKPVKESADKPISLSDSCESEGKPLDEVLTREVPESGMLLKQALPTSLAPAVLKEIEQKGKQVPNTDAIQGRYKTAVTCSLLGVTTSTASVAAELREFDTVISDASVQLETTASVILDAQPCCSSEEILLNDETSSPPIAVPPFTATITSSKYQSPLSQMVANAKASNATVPMVLPTGVVVPLMPTGRLAELKTKLQAMLDGEPPAAAKRITTVIASTATLPLSASVAHTSTGLTTTTAVAKSTPGGGVAASNAFSKSKPTSISPSTTLKTNVQSVHYSLTLLQKKQAAPPPSTKNAASTSGSKVATPVLRGFASAPSDSCQKIQAMVSSLKARMERAVGPKKK